MRANTAFRGERQAPGSLIPPRQGGTISGATAALLRSADKRGGLCLVTASTTVRRAYSPQPPKGILVSARHAEYGRRPSEDAPFVDTETIPMIKPRAGTYALVLVSQRIMHVRIGRTGKLQTQPGFYVYVGSARGPGRGARTGCVPSKANAATALAYRLPESRPGAPRGLVHLRSGPA
jgi:hypothetical protein